MGTEKPTTNNDSHVSKHPILKTVLVFEVIVILILLVYICYLLLLKRGILDAEEIDKMKQTAFNKKKKKKMKEGEEKEKLDKPDLKEEKDDLVNPEVSSKELYDIPPMVLKESPPMELKEVPYQPSEEKIK